MLHVLHSLHDEQRWVREKGEEKVFLNSTAFFEGQCEQKRIVKHGWGHAAAEDMPIVPHCKGVAPCKYLAEVLIVGDIFGAGHSIVRGPHKLVVHVQMLCRVNCKLVNY